MSLNLKSKPLRGFTLVELMVAMAIIAIMLTLAIAGASNGRQVARDADRRNVASKVADEVKDYFRQNATYPTENEGTFEWQTDSAQVGDGTVALSGHLKYSASQTSNAMNTHYTYKRSLGGFAVCVLLESGSWYAVGTLTCP